MAQEFIMSEEFQDEVKRTGVYSYIIVGVDTDCKKFRDMATMDTHMIREGIYGWESFFHSVEVYRYVQRMKARVRVIKMEKEWRNGAPPPEAN